MEVIHLFNKSTYSVVGHISKLEDIKKLEQIILFNLNILKEFKEIIYILNFNKDSIYLNKEIELIFSKFSFLNIKFINNGISLGHSFGAAYNDNKAIQLASNNWVVKSAIDVILQPQILNKKIGKADFYYLNGIGFGGMEKYNYDFNRIINEDFYPQTNFYIINKSKIDYLNNEQFIKDTEYIRYLPDYNGKPWEYIPNWSCEYFLKECIIRNNLQKEHLISQDSYLTLLKIIKELHIHDNSHKNIMIEGICHFHNINEQIIKI